MLLWCVLFAENVILLLQYTFLNTIQMRSTPSEPRAKNHSLSVDLTSTQRINLLTELIMQAWDHLEIFHTIQGR